MLIIIIIFFFLWEYKEWAGGREHVLQTSQPNKVSNVSPTPIICAWDLPTCQVCTDDACATKVAELTYFTLLAFIYALLPFLRPSTQTTSRSPTSSHQQNESSLDPSCTHRADHIRSDRARVDCLRCVSRSMGKP
jgi:hypothetical protein